MLADQVLHWTARRTGRIVALHSTLAGGLVLVGTLTGLVTVARGGHPSCR